MTETLSTAPVEIWDTRAVSQNDSFEYYRESVCKSLFPALPIYESKQPFNARHEAVLLENGLYGRLYCTPYTNERNPKHCANTPIDGYFVVQQLVGGSILTCGERVVRVAQGQTVVVDSRKPLTAVMQGSKFAVMSAIGVPREILKPWQRETLSDGVATIGNRTPLANCLSLLADSISYATLEELQCIYDASVKLLPLEFNSNGKSAPSEPEHLRSEANRLLRRIMIEIGNNIHSDISPSVIAAHFNISVRYLHKLFASTGTTFGAYVLAKRLDGVYNDLRCRSEKHSYISTIANKWGFREITSFNRAFKKRFGHPPKLSGPL
ncbi:helix-turn-helix domain-containing protein [Hyphomicrobium sp.]|uniref:helix-turn-helix domain-containing protein n=1 Tax=Hyphomicrobium sp. TaxID=82 RepID=UPI001E0FDCA2|nr:helix-turn-helix domain-containing protein [Hyphomicrobium sp.]MBY0558933.1 helix-turn-helix domain-containing protein [Hyphomicrobium sp.]